MSRITIAVIFYCFQLACALSGYIFGSRGFPAPRPVSLTLQLRCRARRIENRICPGFGLQRQILIRST
jgi:hypothetical protein